MEPLNVNPPPTIDPSYVAGFDWARQAQFRIEKSFLNKEYWLALSVENAQTTFTQTSIPSTVGTLNFANAGIGVDATGGSFSNNLAPDVIVKAVADYPIAHLEAFGLGSVLNDRVSQVGTGQSNTTFGGGGGGAALIRLIPNVLELNINRHGWQRHWALRHIPVAGSHRRQPRPAGAATGMERARRHRRPPHADD